MLSTQGIEIVNNDYQNKGLKMLTMKVNAENLFQKLMKLDFKLKERYEFNYKNYFVSIDVLTNKIIQVSAKHNTDYENNFNHQFIYYKKKEAIKAIKEKINSLIN
jgi:hypothetical protein